MRIINKIGPLHNPADRDHCLQYAVAIGLIYGELESHHYGDEIAADKSIDMLREKMQVEEDKRYSQDYLDPDKRSIANNITLYFTDGSNISAEVEYPIGHRRRRQDALPLLEEKLKHNLTTKFTADKVNTLAKLLQDKNSLDDLPVTAFMNLWQLQESSND